MYIVSLGRKLFGATALVKSVASIASPERLPRFIATKSNKNINKKQMEKFNFDLFFFW